MGLFKGMKGSVEPSGGDTGGGGPLAQLFREHGGRQGINPNAKYAYDPDAQQYTSMKKGGTASSRADGCCVKGKTKGRMI
jgi:hypothetical protein